VRGLVFSSYVNAYAIYCGAKQLGVEVCTTDRAPVFPLPVAGELNKHDYLFFTEEASLCRALRCKKAGNFLPAAFPLALLDNKWAFSNWLATKPGLTTGLKQWSVDRIDDVKYPCLLKAKHSWHGDQKLPRGWVCNSRHELCRATQFLNDKGFDSSLFFIQQWLGMEGCRVISVCGFHDANHGSRNLTAVVERIASHTQGLSCSAAVETIADEWGVVSRAQDILDSLDFTGPYELEFLVAGRQVFTLELNPRFWMQHAIFLYNGNGLVKRYIGLDGPEDEKEHSINDVVWIDGMHLLRSIPDFNWDFLVLAVRKAFSRDKMVLIFPSVPMALYVGFRSLHSFLKNKVFGKR